MLWAGSVEIINTEFRTFAIWTAKLQLLTWKKTITCLAYRYSSNKSLINNNNSPTRRFPHATLPPDKDPTEGLLLNDILYRCFQK